MVDLKHGCPEREFGALCRSARPLGDGHRNRQGCLSNTDNVHPRTLAGRDDGSVGRGNQGIAGVAVVVPTLEAPKTGGRGQLRIGTCSRADIRTQDNTLSPSRRETAQTESASLPACLTRRCTRPCSPLGRPRRASRTPILGRGMLATRLDESQAASNPCSLGRCRR